MWAVCFHAPVVAFQNEILLPAPCVEKVSVSVNYGGAPMENESLT
jgi:hypothetical protein